MSAAIRPRAYILLADELGQPWAFLVIVKSVFLNNPIGSSLSQVLRSQALLSKAQLGMLKASGREVAYDPLSKGVGAIELR